MYADYHERALYRLLEQSRNGRGHWRDAVERHHAHGKLESAAYHSHDEHQPESGLLEIRRSDSGYRRCDFDGDESIVVHRRQALSFSVFYRNWMGDQGWQKRPHDQKPQLQRNYH